MIVALVGPTAVGKSAAALELARRLGGEIVAVDALTVYRGMDVGTAKPPPEVRAEVPHHMVDILDPAEECTVAWFQRAARAAIADVRARGRIPILVGGSGLYFRAVVDDLRFPPTDPAVRRELERRYAGRARDAHAELARRDPEAAARIDPDNLRRTVRALEVIELTGRPFSSFRTAWEEYRSIYPDLEIWGLDLPDPELRRRIAARAAAMVAGGLLEEVAALARRPLSRTARQAIGYAEALAALAGELAPAELVAAIARRTWRFARRQRAWFRRDPRIRWTRPEQLPVG